MFDDDIPKPHDYAADGLQDMVMPDLGETDPQFVLTYFYLECFHFHLQSEISRQFVIYS
jgi:hypothetical protein